MDSLQSLGQQAAVRQRGRRMARMRKRRSSGGTVAPLMPAFRGSRCVIVLRAMGMGFPR